MSPAAPGVTRPRRRGARSAGRPACLPATADVCGRYTSTTPAARLAETFGVDEVRVEELPIRFNVAPTQLVYAVAESSGPARRRLLGAFRWGLVPPWARDPSVGRRMINARAEGIQRRGAFKEALARRRCIIPADVFY